MNTDKPTTDAYIRHICGETADSYSEATTASAQPENARLETQTFEQFKASYMAKVESGELYESPHETLERENFSLSFWHKKFHSHI